MLSFFAPAYIKEALHVLKNARRLLHYKRDILSETALADFTSRIAALEKAIQGRDRAAVADAAQKLDTFAGKHLPSGSEASWRENCEVFLVAIVIAIGIRTFFLQPFTIPTGSMQPTLNGIIGYPSTEPPPNFAVRAFDFVMRGRNYLDVVATSDDIILGVAEHKVLVFFTASTIQCSHASYSAWAPADTLARYFRVVPGRPLRAGEIIARGAVDAGDHVFVDKVSYNLHLPVRGEVFVFSTRGIPRIEHQLLQQGVEGSEFYIKRLAGLPLDTIRVDSPTLYIDGKVASEFGFQRVMNGQDGYHGYSNPSPFDAPYINSPDSSFTVPPVHYFAMGDNSFNSFDSRYWGPVPQENLMGRGIFVYWPFIPHFGFVR